MSLDLLTLALVVKEQNTAKCWRNVTVLGLSTQTVGLQQVRCFIDLLRTCLFFKYYSFSTCQYWQYRFPIRLTRSWYRLATSVPFNRSPTETQNFKDASWCSVTVSKSRLPYLLNMSAIISISSSCTNFTCASFICAILILAEWLWVDLSNC